jgi:TolB-like protein/Tfp pilus assembly protein PilF
MGRAEEHTHHRVGVELDRVIREIERSHGRVFSFGGDGLMAEFPSAVEALKCSLRIQAEAGRRNAALSPDDRILFRIGINAGEIVLQQERAGGNAVNIAARLEALADPGGIALSDAVFQQVHRVVSVEYAYFGEQRLKNIREPVIVHMVPPRECAIWAGMPALPRQTQVAGSPEKVQDYRASLAVLPFRTLQKDQADSYFAEGIVDDIIRGLGALKDILVIARSSTQAFARAPLDLRRVGHELDVRYVLHGSVRSARDSLRISVELAEAQTGTVIWIERFDGAMADLFDLQDRIAMRVATSVAPHLRGRELTRALRKHPGSMTAFDLTLQATDLFERADRDSLERAESLLKQAVAVDPNYGPGYSHLAALLMRRAAQGWSNDETADRITASNFARTAIKLEPNDAVALAIYGHIHSYLLKDFASARPYLDRALDFGPSTPLAWAYSSLNRGYMRDYAAAVSEAEQAVRLAPIGSDAFRFQHYLSLTLYLNGRYDDAAAWARLAYGGGPTFVSNILCLISSYVAVEILDIARKHGLELLELAPSFRLSAFRSRTPIPADIADLTVNRLRLAGVPD